LFVDHVSPFARAYVARVATQTGDWDVLEALAGDENPNVRTAAVQGLFRLRGHEADGVLRAQLEQDDPQLLLTVAGLLEGTPDPDDAVPLLLEAFLRLSDTGWETLRDPRMAILERLGEVVGEQASVGPAAGLEPYLSDFDPPVADRVAGLLTEWTGERHQAFPKPAIPLPLPSPAELDELAGTRVILEMEGGGEIQIRLFPHLAPTNAARFARLAESGTLDGLTFHRVVANFVLQGGSPNANEMAGHGAYTRDEIGLQSNWRGTVGTSTRGRDTGDGQLFINLVDNLRLDHNYSIFGEVVAGMDVVDQVVEGQKILRARVETP
jgi:cyclophilin family peptidyl-prolyl cis-trans isomerase